MASSAISRPDATDARAAAASAGRDFLAEVDTRHEPHALLGRMFLAGDAALARRNLRLTFATFEDMAALNDANYETWGALVPLFDCRCALIPQNEAFCLFAHDEVGKVVACQAARVIDIDRDGFRRQVESARLFVPGGMLPDNEQFTLATTDADEIAGRVTYSGGLWVHPQARRLNLGAILPRISRAIAHGRWNSGFIVSFARNALVEKGMIERYGYPNIAGPFQHRVDGDVHFDGVVVWMNRDEFIDDTTAFIGELAAEVDVPIRYGRSQ